MSLIAAERHSFDDIKEETQTKPTKPLPQHYQRQQFISSAMGWVVSVAGCLFVLWSLRLYHSFFPVIPND